jgi:hypothetical protein
MKEIKVSLRILIALFTFTLFTFVSEAAVIEYDAAASSGVTLNNTNILTTADRNFTGAGFADYGGAGSYVQWNSVAGSGDHTISFNYACRGTGRSAKLIVNGTTYATKDIPVTYDDNGDRTWVFVGAILSWENIPLSGSSNTIRLESIGNGPNIDKLLVEGLTPSLISNLDVKDVSNAGVWSIESNIQNGDLSHTSG